MNVKPNDLAYIVKAVDPVVIGRIVRIVEWTDCDAWGCWGWLVEFVGDTSGFPEAWSNAACPDAYLRPIGGVPVEDEVDEHMKEPA